jgi:hypothetical protein
VRIFLLNICNLITGATRPDAERVFQNIKTTIEALSEHDCEHYALTYKTDESLKLQEKIKNENLNVNLFLIDPIEEAIGGYNGNNYRMVRCIELLAEKVENLSSFDCVLRHRIDCELLSIEVPEVIKENTYYAPWMPWNLPFDNIGLMTPEVFKKVFHTDITFFDDTKFVDRVDDKVTHQNALSISGGLNSPWEVDINKLETLLQSVLN